MKPLSHITISILIASFLFFPLGFVSFQNTSIDIQRAHATHEGLRHDYPGYDPGHTESGLSEVGTSALEGAFDAFICEGGKFSDRAKAAGEAAASEVIDGALEWAGDEAKGWLDRLDTSGFLSDLTNIAGNALPGVGGIAAGLLNGALGIGGGGSTPKEVQDVENVQKEGCLDALAKVSAKEAMGKLQDAALTFLRGDLETGPIGNVGFIEDLGQYVRDAAEREFLEYVQEEHSEIYTQACGIFRNPEYGVLMSLEQQMRSRYPESAGIFREEIPDLPESFGELGCDLEQHFDQDEDLRDFVAGDFSKGGWGAYYDLLTDPASNPQSVKLRAQRELQKRLEQRENQSRTEAQQGGGYLPDLRCDGGEHPGPDGLCPDTDGDGDREAPTVATPAGAVQRAMNDIITGDLRRAELADEINETIEDVGSLLLTKVFDRGLRNATPTDFDTEVQISTIETQLQLQATRTNGIELLEELQQIGGVCPDILAANDYHDIDETTADPELICPDGSGGFEDCELDGSIWHTKRDEDGNLKYQQHEAEAIDEYFTPTPTTYSIELPAGSSWNTSQIDRNLGQCLEENPNDDSIESNVQKIRQTLFGDVYQQCSTYTERQEVVRQLREILYGQNPNNGDYSVDITVDGQQITSSQSLLSPPEALLNDCGLVIEEIQECDLNGDNDLTGSSVEGDADSSTEWGQCEPVGGGTTREDFDSIASHPCNINSDNTIGLPGGSRPRNFRGEIINNPNLNESSSEVQALNSAYNTLLDKAESLMGTDSIDVEELEKDYALMVVAFDDAQKLISGECDMEGGVDTTSPPTLWSHTFEVIDDGNDISLEAEIQSEEPVQSCQVKDRDTGDVIANPIVEQRNPANDERWMFGPIALGLDPNQNHQLSIVCETDSNTSATMEINYTSGLSG